MISTKQGYQAVVIINDEQTIPDLPQGQSSGRANPDSSADLRRIDLGLSTPFREDCCTADPLAENRSNHVVISESGCMFFCLC